MSRAINHFSITRINSVELRVVSDVREGALQVIQAEESVIQAYTRSAPWPHQWITLFILEDLQPLLRQFNQEGILNIFPFPGKNISTAELTTLSQRPVINIYDLADLSTCNIFVNQQEMMVQHYWEDPQAIRGLLAHEHAHPLAENEMTKTSRQINFHVSGGEFSTPQKKGVRLVKITQVLDSLGEKLSLLASREILTNEMAIRYQFSEDLLHLNIRNMENTSISISDRAPLVQHLLHEVTQGDLTEKEMDLIILVGDLNSILPLALEIAPFYRAGKPEEGQILEQILESKVFPFLDPLAVQCFTQLRDHYISLPSGDQSVSNIVKWYDRVILILNDHLMVKDFSLKYVMELTEK
ncbi:MAG: hypothetical protein NTZ74_08615 [Chloroflexi bacterium]|nr:hypothetical protein [Chloroflexota bacterium]